MPCAICQGRSCGFAFEHLTTVKARRGHLSATSKNLGGLAHGPENVFYCVGVIFAAVALLHLVRIYLGWPVMIGDWSVPMWLSWIGLIIAGGLAFFGMSLATRDAR